ncbi:MAG: sigma-70 family RNA polymerase sigma factor [Rhodospirillales bacterium]|nr:sigma-70 family RNA polymerase sigma factor [Rhodospirillales bacterium]
MQSAQAGDRARYAALLAAVLPPLRRAARARWPQADPAAIEDAVQETLLALHASRHLYDPARPFLPFLFGIMRFRGADVMRRTRRQRARETPIDGVPETSDALVTNSYPDAGLEAAALREAVGRLPEGQRRAIEMTKFQELTLEEASTASGMSVAALKVATHRGLLALRKRMNGSR